MSQIQQFKRLIVEDFDSKDKELVGKIAYSVNTFADDVSRALNNNISIENNMNIIKKTFTITLDSKGNVSGGNSIKTNLTHNCDGITVIKVINTTTPSLLPTGTPFISFTEPSIGTISINNITNLAASNSYTIKAILF